MAADSAMLQLDNHKNGCHSVCIHHETNGGSVTCSVHVLGCDYISIHGHSKKPKVTLSAYFTKGTHHDVTDKHMQAAHKYAAVMLGNSLRGFPIEQINTHSLCSGWANALALVGYSDTQLQKMGHQKCVTLKENIQEELYIFSVGMSINKKHKF